MPTLDPLLRPRSIAVVGASRTPDTLGYQILDNLRRHGFASCVYPVNPVAPSVHSVRAYSRVADIPGTVELAVIVVPRQHLLRVAASQSTSRGRNRKDAAS